MQSIIFRCHKTFASFWIFMTWTLHQLQPEHDLIKTSYGTNIKLTVCFSRQRNSVAQKRPNTFIYMMLSIRSFPSLLCALLSVHSHISSVCVFVFVWEHIYIQQSTVICHDSLISNLLCLFHRSSSIYYCYTSNVLFCSHRELRVCEFAYCICVCLSVFICGCVRNTRVC